MEISCSKDRFDWGMASHACASLWVLKFISPLSIDLPTLKRLIHTLPHRRIGSISMTLIEWTFLTQWPAVVLFSSATYLFTNYNHRAVGLLPNSLRIFSLRLFNMSAGEEEEHGMEAIIKALNKGFDRYQGFTDGFPETSDLQLELIGTVWRFSALHQGHGELVHTPRYTWQR